jgi:major membrane immunogen (membrane-anchored lipoprotein)
MFNNKLRNHQRYALVILLLLYGFIPLFLTGCVEKELINDPTTGSILSGENSKSLMDGQYSATTSYFDTRGYVQKLDLLIKNGIITQVSFKELSKSNADRLTLEGSDKNWKNLGVANLGALYLRLYNELILSQNPDEIDAVSGATQTSECFTKLSTAILAQALKGDHETIKIDTFDTYTITGTADPDGYQGFLQASFNGPTLTSLSYDEIRAEDGKSKRKSTDSPVNTDFSALFDTITNNAIESQSLESPFPTNETSPDKAKYIECLRLLKEARAPF